MSHFDNQYIVAMIIALGMAVVAFAGHRMSLGTVLRSLLGWAAIGVVAFVVVQHRYEIGAMVAGVSQSLGIDDQQVDGKTIRIRMSPDGHFWARVKLNGFEKHMLIDSGATITAISETTARAAGVKSSGSLPVTIETANGDVTARRARVAELAVGPLRTRDISVVISENFGDFDVLGMNFLSRLKSWRVEGQTLILEPGGDAGGEAEDVASVEDPPRPAR